MIHYYAIEYTYGLGMVDDDGAPVADVYRFPTRAAARAFAASGPARFRDPRYREVATAKHPLVRDAISGGHWQPAHEQAGEVAQ